MRSPLILIRKILVAKIYSRVYHPFNFNLEALIMSQNQSVQVNIQGHGWLVGTVVAIINAVKAVGIPTAGLLAAAHLLQISGSHVRVRYVEPRGHREGDFPNSPDYIRPYYD